MKRKFKILTLLLGAVIMFSACEEDERTYSDIDPFNSDLKTTALLSQPNQTVFVDPTKETTTVIIGVKTWGAILDQELTIPFSVVSSELEESWYSIAGNGFTIPAGENQGVLIMTIDNASIPGGYYALNYELGTPSVSTVNVNELAMTGTIDAFSPGDLWPFMGNYNAYAVSYFTPGDWDEEWSCNTVLNRDDPNSIDIYGIGSTTSKFLTATIDLDAGTIVAEDGQDLGDIYGYGATIAVGFPVMQGTVNVADGSFNIDDIRLNMTGDYDGYVWDIFDATFTKAGKKSNFVERIPENKRPTKFE